MVIYSTFLLLSFLFGLHVGRKSKEIPLAKVKPKISSPKNGIDSKPVFYDQFETIEYVSEKPFITHHVKTDNLLMSEEWEVFKIN